MVDLSGLDLTSASRSDPNEYKTNCPECINRVGKADVKEKLGINIKTGIFHCFRCGYSGRVTSDASFLQEEEESTLSEIKDKISSIGTKEKSNEEGFDLEKISDPVDSTNTPLAYQYIKSRGFSDREIRGNSLRVGKPYWDSTKNSDEFKWSGRLLFPFFEDGYCRFIVGRSINGKEPKYLNSEGNRNLVVYGIDKVIGDECILCEGIISSIAAQRQTGVPAVATLGKYVTMDQISKIRNKCNRIYVSMDGDVTNGEISTLRNLFKNLIRFNFETYLVKLPSESDPDDLGPNYRYYFSHAEKVHFL